MTLELVFGLCICILYYICTVYYIITYLCCTKGEGGTGEERQPVAEEESTTTANQRVPTEDSIHIRLKFLDDNEKLVMAKKSDTIGAFKR